MEKSSEDSPDNLADVVGLSHGVEMYGWYAVLQKLAALLDGPVDTQFVGILGCLCFFHQADEFLRNINVERTRKQVYLLARREGFQTRNDGNGDTCFATHVNEAEELLVVEEHLGDDIIGSGLDLAAQMLDVGVEIGSLEVLLGIGCHTDAEVRCKSALDGWVEILSAIQVANHLHQF